jgi:hypothetical protein
MAEPVVERLGEIIWIGTVSQITSHTSLIESTGCNNRELVNLRLKVVMEEDQPMAV